MMMMMMMMKMKKKEEEEEEEGERGEREREEKKREYIYIYAVRPVWCLHFWLFDTRTALLFCLGGDMRNYPGLCDRFRPSLSLLRSVSVTNVYLSLSPKSPQSSKP